jgi:acyl-CoA reductase-like NAD-dependent aldehyde dehydrogenase
MTEDLFREHDELFIDGHSRLAHSAQRLSVVNPATEEQFATIPAADAQDVDTAVLAARRALRSPGWADLEPSARADLLRRLADAIERRGEVFGRAVSMQNGMALPLATAYNGAATAIYYRYFAELADALQTEVVRTGHGTRTLVRREPVGVAALIVPWNGPQTAIAWKLGPALAAGCTVVIKPAPETSLDAYLLAEAVEEAGIPAGVVNIVTGGAETGAALVEHPLVDKIAFTGSTAAGRSVGRIASERFARVTLELGGKSAAVLLDDVDLSTFLPFVATACTPYSGQVCRALTRVLVPRRRYAEVVDALADTVGQLVVGDPLDPRTQIGPLVTARQRDRVEDYLGRGQAAGAKAVVGGGRPSDRPVGYYIEPTVFSDADNTMPIAREEIFGPVLTVIGYDDDEDALRIADDSDYGLGGAVFTADYERGLGLARRIRSGSVGVNQYALPIDAPFGGVKHSGIGRELGPEGLDAYLEYKSIYLPI